MKIHWRKISIISFFLSLLLSISFSAPSLAHWADLSVAEVSVGEKETAITLTFPTDLVVFSDDNRDGQLSREETVTHKRELEQFLGDRIFLSNEQGKKGTVAIASVETNNLLPTLKVNTNTHSTLQLNYSWLQPVQNQRMHYDLFLAEAPAAHCLATIFHKGKVQNFIFNRQNRDFWLISGAVGQFGGSLAIALMAAFVWGAMHAMSPGHGKTIVGAYLMGSKVTAQHALFLGLTTTLTHTIGVFILGLATLFASQFILPERILPWLSILSGFMVLVIGLNLFISRLRNHDHDHHHHHDHDHDHHHDHDHDHHHLPSNTPVTMGNLLALGVSGGLVPCPSALVLLLSAIAIGRVGFGLMLVVAFSLGLAAVLTGLGLLLIYAKQWFEKLQLPKPKRLHRILPALSAFLISLIGLGITTQALIEVGIVRL
ncbi:MAG: sulfite exporter TauE/SafE family protein [Tolypothrix brevis GSE-NOS-MK-07-07A]|jgi:ABC-type nickel/cobalt efflux system permease component RcnA|nr:sulfite exporter TauE/SafE family protein [Tolypothrix brevis GSE-NOS-MK-07-07A]